MFIQGNNYFIIVFIVIRPAIQLPSSADNITFICLKFLFELLRKKTLIFSSQVALNILCRKEKEGKYCENTTETTEYVFYIGQYIYIFMCMSVYI